MEKGEKERNGMEVELQVTDMDGEETINIPRVWSVEKLHVSERSIPEKEDLKKWDHVDGFEFPSIEDRNVMLLIGADVAEAFWVMDEIHGNRGEPCAVKLPLGWTLIGPTASFTYLAQRHHKVVLSQENSTR